MRSIKHIALSAFVTLSVFSAVIFSACSKNGCGDVTCLNDATCTGGICTCVTGTDGINCQNVYRNNYAHSYKGIPPDDPNSDTTNTLILIPTEDTTNYNTMVVIWIDTTGASRLQLPLELNNNSASGSNFSITPTTYGIFTYTGAGAVNGRELSMSIHQQDTAGVVVVSYFNNYIRH